MVINMLVAAGPVQPKHCPSTLPDEFVTAHAMCCRVRRVLCAVAHFLLGRLVAASIVASVVRLMLSPCGPQDATVDMDNLLQRQSMDVIGKVAFGTNLGALRSLQDGSQGVNRAMDSLVRGVSR